MEALGFRHWLILLTVSQLLFLYSSYGSPSGSDDTEKPVITPSRLVVKHGDPASAVCSLSKPCINCQFNWEVSQGETTRINETHVRWEVDKVSNWGMNPRCFYDLPNGDQPQSRLNIILYKPPDSVSLSYWKHTGPLLEGEHYYLVCEVRDVAPAETLTVTFYRGDMVVGPPTSWNKQEKKPINVTFTQDITSSREDDGAQYWCEAKLDLGPEGPQPPPVVRSLNLSGTVYYKPHRELIQHHYDITEGDHKQLNCSATGNPTPTYIWIFPTSNPALLPNDDILTINHITFDHAGRYTCVASNLVGNTTVTFDVVVKVDFLPIIAGLVALAVVAIIVIAFFVYTSHYRHTRMGHYQLKDVFHFRRSSHVAQPNGMD